MKALITRGCQTDHGGIVQEADNSYLIEGIPVHLEGMKHFCPKCKVMSTAQSSGRGFMMVGSKTIIMAGDTSTCGSKYLPNQGLVLRDAGTGTSGSTSVSAISSFLNSNNAKVFDEQVVAEFSFAEGMPYFIETENGKTYKGIIGADGKLPRIETEGSEAYSLYLGEEAIVKGSESDS